LAVPLCATV